MDSWNAKDIVESALDTSDMESSALNIDICKFLKEGTTREDVEDECSLILLKMLEGGDLHADITIEAKGGSVKAHSSVLASVSPVFYAMFKHQMREKLSSTVEFPEMSIEGLELFLVLVYIVPDDTAAMDGFSGSIIGHFEELFDACCRYKVPRLEPTLTKNFSQVLNCDNCWEYLRKSESVSGFCSILDYKTSNDGPYAVCRDYIDGHFDKVIRSESFTLAMQTDPENVLVCLRKITESKVLPVKPTLKRSLALPVKPDLKRKALPGKQMIPESEESKSDTSESD